MPSSSGSAAVSLSQACIVIPTFNEADNIARLIEALLKIAPEAWIVVVDDASPDGTGAAADAMAGRFPRVEVIHRKGKGGRGSACMAGFRHALKKPEVSVFIEMNADFSHDPAELAETVAALGEADLVVRSRYLPQSRILNWPPSRRVFSKLSNIFARVLLGMPLTDYTNGYRAYTRAAVSAIEFDKIVSAGYIVLSVTALQLFRKGFRLAELPSVFVNRKRGESNLTRREIAGALLGVLRLRFPGSAAQALGLAVLAAVILAGVPLALIYWRTGYFSGYISDFTVLASRAHRTALGQRIYHDFDCITTPGAYLIQGGLYRLLGEHWSVTRWYIALQGCAAAALTFMISRLLLGLGGAASLACAAIGLFWSPEMIGGLPWYDSDAGFFGLLALASLLWLWDRRSSAGSALFGFFCACVFWCKQDVGGAALVLGFACNGARAYGRPAKEIAREQALFLAGAALPTMILLAWIGPGLAWEWLVRRALAFGWQRSGTSLPMKIWLTAFGGRSQFGKALVLFYGLVFGVSLWAARRGNSRRPLLVRNAWAALFAGGMSYAGFLTHDGAHFEFLQSQLGCLVAILMHSAQADGPLALALAGLLACRGLKYANQNAFSAPAGYAALDTPVLAGLKFPTALAASTNEILRFLRETVKGEPFAVLPPDFIPDLHMALGAAPPQPLTALVEALPEDFPRVIAALEQNRVTWVITSAESLRALGPAREYLENNFVETARLPDGIIALRRR